MGHTLCPTEKIGLHHQQSLCLARGIQGIANCALVAFLHHITSWHIPSTITAPPKHEVLSWCCLSGCVSICLSVSSSACVSVPLSVCLSVHLSVRPSVHPSVCMHMHAQAREHSQLNSIARLCDCGISLEYLGILAHQCQNTVRIGHNKFEKKAHKFMLSCAQKAHRISESATPWAPL